MVVVSLNSLFMVDSMYEYIVLTSILFEFRQSLDEFRLMVESSCED